MTRKDDRKCDVTTLDGRFLSRPAHVQHFMEAVEVTGEEEKDR